MQAELFARQSQAKVALDAQAFERRIVHLGIEELEVVPTFHLGVIHRGVGVLHQNLTLVAVDREHRDADAGRRVEIVATDLARPADAGHQLFGNQCHGAAMLDL